MMAQTAHKRMAIAARAGCELYLRENPGGVSPGEVFLEEYLKPFIDCELAVRTLDDLHKETQKKELELISEVTRLKQICVERMHEKE